MGSGVWGLGFRVRVEGLRGWGWGGLWFRVWGVGFGGQGVGFRGWVSGFGFRVSGFGFTSFAASYDFLRACLGFKFRVWVLGMGH